MDFSVIIINYNDQEHLDHCYKSLTSILSSNDQLIIVDDGSSPRLEIDLKLPQCRVDKIYIPRTEKSCRSKARNLGAKEAIHDHLIFLDGDGIAFPVLIDSYRENFKNFEGVILGSRMACPFETLDFNSLSAPLIFQDHRYEMFRYLNLDIDEMVTKWVYFWSHNFAISKQLYDQVGGMDENFVGWGGEDAEFGYRLCQHNVKYKMLDVGVIGDTNQVKTDKHWKELLHNLEYMYDKHQDPAIREYIRIDGNCPWKNVDRWLVTYEQFEQYARSLIK